jgi:hypothetical protein
VIENPLFRPFQTQVNASLKLEVFNYSLNGFIAPSLKEVRDPNEGYLGSLTQDMMISKRPES